MQTSSRPKVKHQFMVLYVDKYYFTEFFSISARIFDFVTRFTFLEKLSLSYREDALSCKKGKATTAPSLVCVLERRALDLDLNRSVHFLNVLIFPPEMLK